MDDLKRKSTADFFAKHAGGYKADELIAFTGTYTFPPLSKIEARTVTTNLVTSTYSDCELATTHITDLSEELLYKFLSEYNELVEQDLAKLNETVDNEIHITYDSIQHLPENHSLLDVNESWERSMKIVKEYQ